MIMGQKDMFIPLPGCLWFEIFRNFQIKTPYMIGASLMSLLPDHQVFSLTQPSHISIKH
jgi:hypothetical protein